MNNRASRERLALFSRGLEDAQQAMQEVQKIHPVAGVRVGTWHRYLLVGQVPKLIVASSR